jgi:hypothetical protein
VPLTLRWGTVTAVTQRLDELVRCEVDEVPCIAFPRQTGPVEVGDTVIVNTQARDLGLGSGGFDVVYANLTPGQAVAVLVEEDGSLADDLDGMPVVCTGLHSQLAPVLAGIGAGARVAYAQLAGGALPVSLSDAVRLLKTRQLLDTAIAVAPCIDGDVQAFSLAAALAWAKARGFDLVVCGIGPGIVGTGSALGHGGLALADAASTTAALGGRPVVAVRYSGGDERERHRGVSHHVTAALRLARGPRVVAWPDGLDPPPELGNVVVVPVQGWEDACAGLTLDHMGRGPADDPWFFAAAFAAGRHARSLVAGS